MDDIPRGRLGLLVLAVDRHQQVVGEAVALAESLRDGDGEGSPSKLLAYVSRIEASASAVALVLRDAAAEAAADAAMAEILAAEMRPVVVMRRRRDAQGAA